jgi:hypothetical protein
MRLEHIGDAIGGALAIAAVSTLGDYLWANVLPHHRPIYGLTHGTLLFLAVGLYLGARAHRPATGAVVGGLLGFLAAGSFYVLQPMLGYTAMFLMYIGVWVGLGLLNGRVLQPIRAPLSEVMIRSLLAAIGSGVAFYAISGIWFPFHPHGWDYAVHFAAWTVAYLPGFAALLVSRP